MNKILYIISNFSIGGAQRITFTLSNWMKEHEVEPVIVAIGTSQNNYDLPSDIKCICLNQASPKQYFKSVKELRATVVSEKPDLVITMGVPVCIYSVPALRALKIKHIISERSDPKSFRGKRIVKLISRWLMRRADGFVFQTQDALEFYPKKIQKKATVIPNPIMATNMPDATACKKEKVIVTMGRLIAPKNHKMLIDAFDIFHKEHTEYTLHIYGSGELREETQSYVNSLSLTENVILHDACSDVHEKISSAEMFVLSSNFEGMPNALMEAMAMGIASISTDCPCGGPRYLIEDGENGLLVPVGDSKKTAEAMTRLAEDDILRAKLAKNAKELNVRLSADNICSKWLDFIKLVFNIKNNKRNKEK